MSGSHCSFRFTQPGLRTCPPQPPCVRQSSSGLRGDRACGWAHPPPGGPVQVWMVAFPPQPETGVTIKRLSVTLLALIFLIISKS